MIWESSRRKVEELLKQTAVKWDRRRERELLVLAPDWKEAGSFLSAPFRCILIPGEDSLWGTGFRTGCIVSYGMSPRDSLTFSSVGEHRSVLALQRELVTLDGVILERQELLLGMGWGRAKPEELLAAAGALLLMGARPNSLEKEWVEGRAPELAGQLL